MRPPPKHCHNCGARILRPGSQARCDYCSTELELAAPPRVVERERRFARLRADPGLPALLARPVGGGGQLAAASIGLILSGGIVVVGVLAASASTNMHAPGAFRILPLLFVGIAILGFVQILRRTARFAQDAGRATPALVVDERVEVRGGRDSSHTQNYATLEDEDGQRRELETSAEVAGRIAAGDAGVAYERGGVLVHFARMDV